VDWDTAGLIGLIQLAGAHPSELIGTLGHNNRTTWFQDNTEAIFQADGPLGMFRSVSPAVLARHFTAASIQARDIYDHNHSVDQSGAAHEDVPPWAQHFFVWWKPSRMCRLLPPRQQSSGARDAVYCRD